MKKKYTATIEEELRDRANALAKERGINLSELTESMIISAENAHEMIRRIKQSGEIDIDTTKW